MRYEDVGFATMPHPLGRPRVQSAAVPREQPWRILARATELTGVTPQRWIICTMCWLQAEDQPVLTARQVEDIARPSRASHPVRQHGKIDTFRPLLAHPDTTNAQVRDLGVWAVEVPGIEPGSSVASRGLLRAQPALSLLGSTGHADEPV
jgi:hypothetical protein